MEYKDIICYSKTMEDLRSKKTGDRYAKLRAQKTFNHECRLCPIKSIKDFKYWKIIDNEYPWDLVSKINHILVTKRHTTYQKLNNAEKKEFDSIKANYINENYQMMVEATDRAKSIPNHFHMQLILLKNLSSLKNK